MLNEYLDRTTDDEVESILDIVLRLFNKSNYANIRTRERDTPIHYACRSGNIMALKKLEEVFGDEIDWHSTNSHGPPWMKLNLDPFGTIDILDASLKPAMIGEQKPPWSFFMGRELREVERG